jgi:hypothetical protein
VRHRRGDSPDEPLSARAAPGAFARWRIRTPCHRDRAGR